MRDFLEPEQRRIFPRIKNACRVLVAFIFSHVGVCGLVVGYIICGAFLFQEIESQEKDPQVEVVRRIRNDTAHALLSIVLTYNTLEEAVFQVQAGLAIENYTLQIVSAINRGYEGEPLVGHAINVNNASSPTGKVAWSFSGSFLYSLTVITTIGYGNTTPKTPWGKVTTILYGIGGMPLFLLYLSNIGGILARGFKWTFARCCQCRWNCVAKNTSEDGEGEEEEVEEQITVPISLCLALMVCYIWGGGILFSKWEHWSVLDASYFCFISLSTIGFGDLVPGDQTLKANDESIQLSFILCSLYLLLGMALIAMCFQLMQEEVVATVRKIGSHLGCSRK